MDELTPDLTFPEFNEPLLVRPHLMEIDMIDAGIKAFPRFFCKPGNLYKAEGLMFVGSESQSQLHRILLSEARIDRQYLISVSHLHAAVENGLVVVGQFAS